MGWFGHAILVLGIGMMTNMLVHISAHATEPLDAYAWEKRILIVFSPSDTDDRLIAQRAMNVASLGGLQERDMAIFSVLPEALIAELGPLPDGDPQIVAATLRETYTIPDDSFYVVLVGKDGDEKARIESTLPPVVLFDIIDAMPMRQREMTQPE
ncbi:MAG: DUF4174 domain-containing protein [Pseudomonadota bacterium]